MFLQEIAKGHQQLIEAKEVHYQIEVLLGHQHHIEILENHYQIDLQADHRHHIQILAVVADSALAAVAADSVAAAVVLAVAAEEDVKPFETKKLRLSERTASVF